MGKKQSSFPTESQKHHCRSPHPSLKIQIKALFARTPVFLTEILPLFKATYTHFGPWKKNKK